MLSEYAILSKDGAMTARYVLPALLLSVSITGALTAKDARSTIFLGLRPVNCPETTARDIGDKIRGRLDRLTYCDLITEKKSERAMRTGGIKSPCTDRQCSVAIARVLKSERAVYGTVGITTVTFGQRMGKDGAGKYLLREKEVRKYVIALTLLDADKNTVIAAVTDNAEDATLDRAIGRIVARLQLFFAPLN